MKPKILIITGSIREGRKSPLVTAYLEKFINSENLAEIISFDVKNLPFSEERLKYLTDPHPSILDFSEKVKNADAIILVSPEYNSGYPAAMKNAIDLLYDEWYRKPIGIVTVSSGNFGGITALEQLQTVMLKVRALPMGIPFPITQVQKTFNESGEPVDKEALDKRASNFMKELLWLTEKLKR